MWKKVLIGAAALAIAGSTFVYAQHRPFGPRPSFAFNTEDMPALLDARIAALKTGLRLTADQEKDWPAFEDAYRGLAKLRFDRMSAMRNESPPANPLEGLQRRAEAFTQHGAALKKLADATAPLFNSFDEGQKRRFHILARPMGPRLAHFAQRDGFRGPPGRGFERERDVDSPRSPRGSLVPERLQWIDPQSEDL